MSNVKSSAALTEIDETPVPMLSHEMSVALTRRRAPDAAAVPDISRNCMPTISSLVMSMGLKKRFCPKSALA